MKCPTCNGSLQKKYLDQIELDVCDACHGVWFDAGELPDTARKMIASGKVPDAKIDLDKQVFSIRKLNEALRTCPHCRREMQKVNFAYDSNVIVDKCGECGGIWADEPELMQLATFLKGNPMLERMGSAIAEERISWQKEREQLDRAAHSMRHGRFRSYGYHLRIILPLGDDQERHSFPFTVLVLIALNVTVFLWQMIVFRFEVPQSHFVQMGLVPARAFGLGYGSLGWISSMFTHGGMWHLFGNMLFLWIFGDNVEDAFGHARFVVAYFIFGLSASLLYVLFNSGSFVPMIGASGAISGVLGAYLVLYPSANIKTLVYVDVINIPAAVYLGGWFLMQLFFLFFEDRDHGFGGGVAWLAHIGGFASGFVVAFAWRLYPGSKKGNKEDLDNIKFQNAA